MPDFQFFVCFCGIYHFLILFGSSVLLQERVVGMLYLIAKIFTGAAICISTAWAQTTATCDVPLDNSISVDIHNGIASNILRK